MKAMVFPRYGAPDVLTLRDVPRPEPHNDEVRIAVRATTVTAACGLMRRGDTAMARVVLGLFRPRRRFRILGIELCGVVDKVGKDVTRFRVGQRVFGFAGMHAGANAEFVCLRETASLAPAPDGLSDLESASLVDGPTTALYFLRRAKLAPGMRVAIIGASGSVGSAAVQVARHMGAHVTAVCSGNNAELVRGLGAQEVVDYTREDYAQRGVTYDVVFDTVGKSSHRVANHCLVKGGVYAVTVGGAGLVALDLWTRWFSRTRLLFGYSVEKNAALLEVNELTQHGALRPVIDRQYPLAELAEAHRYVEAGHKRGNVVITVAAG
ncbi:MAG: NAD(P)-dependent alcohol dehydrogenase [Deltaproteobacteria bacterium]|nr:NAD(P)-dependent alcohol dehydrogenase [Deltaproteobacteria bacterium]